MIHRAPFGSMERFRCSSHRAYGRKIPACGLLPIKWLFMPISAKFNDYARDRLLREFGREGYSCICRWTGMRKIGRKIRDNELKRIPYLLVVGEKEAENGEVSVRKQGEGDKGSMKIATFAEILTNAEVEELLDKPMVV